MSRILSSPSLHQDRIYRLSQQIDGIQFSRGPERGSRLENLDRRMRGLEEALWEIQEQSNRRISDLREHLTVVQKAMDECRIKRDAVFNKKAAELADFESKLEELLADEIEVGNT